MPHNNRCIKGGFRMKKLLWVLILLLLPLTAWAEDA